MSRIITPRLVRLIVIFLVLVAISVVSFILSWRVLGVILGVLALCFAFACFWIARSFGRALLGRDAQAFKSSDEFSSRLAQKITRESHSDSSADTSNARLDIDEITGPALATPCATDSAFLAGVPTRYISRINKMRKQEREYTYDWLMTAPKWELVCIEAPDGTKLSAHVMYTSNRARWAVLCHGYCGTWKEMMPLVRMYGQHAFNLLILDMRAHGQSSGSVVGMGYLDANDIVAWTKWIDSHEDLHEPSCTILHGHSMGASAVIMASAKEDLSPHVQLAVAEASFATGEEAIRRLYTAYAPELPEQPILDLACAYIACKRGGYNIYDANPIDVVGDSRVPLLFVHGDADPMVSVESSRELYRAAPQPKELLIIEGAGHCACSFLDPYGYFGTIFQMINR